MKKYSDSDVLKILSDVLSRTCTKIINKSHNYTDGYMQCVQDMKTPFSNPQLDAPIIPHDVKDIQLSRCPFCDSEMIISNDVFYHPTGKCVLSECTWLLSEATEWNTRKHFDRAISNVMDEMQYSRENFREVEVIYRKGLRKALEIMTGIR